MIVNGYHLIFGLALIGAIVYIKQDDIMRWMAKKNPYTQWKDREVVLTDKALQEFKETLPQSVQQKLAEQEADIHELEEEIRGLKQKTEKNAKLNVHEQIKESKRQKMKEFREKAKSYNGNKSLKVYSNESGILLGSKGKILHKGDKWTIIFNDQDGKWRMIEPKREGELFPRNWQQTLDEGRVTINYDDELQYTPEYYLGMGVN